MAVLNPSYKQRIGHREHDRGDKDPHNLKCDKTTDDASEDQQEREVGTLLDYDRAHQAIEEDDGNRPHQQRRSHPTSPFQYSHITAGMSTNPGPRCATRV